MSKEDIIRFLERKMVGSDNRRGPSRVRDSREREVHYNISGSTTPGGNHYRGTGSDSRKEVPYDYEDYRDYEERDYHQYKHIRLTKSDIQRWKQMMHNVDGSHGEHYDMQQAMHAAEKLGIRFNAYDEKEFCLALNMMYSDYGHVIRKYCPPEKELMVCAELAKAFFDDPDGPEPSEKLALYFHCIADNE